MAEPMSPPAPRRDIPRRELNYSCAVCGWPATSGVHLPALTGPRKGKPWGHEYVPPPGVTGMPSDCERINCRKEWAGGEKCPTGTCEFARGVIPSAEGQQ